MNTYVAIIDGEAVLAFRADSDNEAYFYVNSEPDDPDGLTGDLLCYDRIGPDGKREPLWDGESLVLHRLATADEHARWKSERDQAVRDPKMGLDDENDFNLFLVPVCDGVDGDNDDGEAKSA